ncbi:MAG: ATP synthase subunit b [Alphaproteobacteria bacterium MarineAlpha4_Bin2]|nr:MAG: ATP synthase subunit b [Alphaproteobacteria bacterium MarineAlpha4_Bin2]
MEALIHDPTFWVAVAFVVFVVLVFKPIKGALVDGLDAKILEIRQQVEEAERLGEEAQSLLANYQRQQRQAIQDAEAIVARAKEEADRHRVEADEAMKAMVRRQEEQAREKIAQAEAAAIQEVRTLSVELAMAAAERLLVERLVGEEGANLIDRSIEEIPRKLQ